MSGAITWTNTIESDNGTACGTVRTERMILDAFDTALVERRRVIADPSMPASAVVIVGADKKHVDELRRRVNELIERWHLNVGVHERAETRPTSGTLNIHFVAVGESRGVPPVASAPARVRGSLRRRPHRVPDADAYGDHVTSTKQWEPRALGVQVNMIRDQVTYDPPTVKGVFGRGDWPHQNVVFVHYTSIYEIIETKMFSAYHMLGAHLEMIKYFGDEEATRQAEARYAAETKSGTGGTVVSCDCRTVCTSGMPTGRGARTCGARHRGTRGCE
jgi:hypothetical protein